MLTEFEIYIGADATKEIQFTEGGSPVDLTGAVLTIRGRKSRSSDTVVWTAEVTLDPDPTTGRFTMTLPVATTDGLECGSGVWDATMTIGGVVTVPIEDETYVIRERVSR